MRRVGMIGRQLMARGTPANIAKLPELLTLGRRHSITLSARANNASGTVTPIALAVLRLITKSNLVGCSTGMSAILLPLKRWTIFWDISS